MQIKYSDIGIEPVTLDEVKAWLKVDFDTEDDLITSLITGVREEVEEFTGLSLVEKTIEYFDEYIEEEITLPYPEHNEIIEVVINGVISTSYTSTGSTQIIITPSTLNATTDIDNRGIKVTYTTIGTCPNALKNMIKKIIADEYRNRGNTFKGAIAELSENAYAKLMQFCIS